MELIGVLIAILVGVFIGKDAASRGMNAWGWGIATACLMILFLPLYLIVRKPVLKAA